MGSTDKSTQIEKMIMSMMTTMTVIMMLTTTTMLRMGWLGGLRPPLQSDFPPLPPTEQLYSCYGPTHCYCPNTSEHTAHPANCNCPIHCPTQCPTHCYCPTHASHPTHCPTLNTVKLPKTLHCYCPKKAPRVSIILLLNPPHTPANTYSCPRHVQCPPRTAHRGQTGGKLFWMRFGFGKLIWIRGTGRHLGGQAKRQQDSAGHLESIMWTKKKVFNQISDWGVSFFLLFLNCNPGSFDFLPSLAADWGVLSWTQKGLVFHPRLLISRLIFSDWRRGASYSYCFFFFSKLSQMQLLTQMWR